MSVKATVNGRRLVCDGLGFIPRKVVVCPWGKVQSSKGDFTLDHEAAGMVLEAFKRKGVDLPIDYEHATVGGKHASPDGKAPAAGWIKSLESVPGHGLLAGVEWGEVAGRMLAAREYRYLSPVVIIDEGSRKVIELHSVGLTNKPAIANFPPIVNSEGGAMPSGHAAEILAGLAKIVERGTEGSAGADVLLETMRDLLQSGRAMVCEGEKLVASDAQVNGEAAFVGKTKVLSAANQALRMELDQREFAGLIAAHSDAIPPAIRDSLKSWWCFDKKGATAFIESAPRIVNIDIGQAGQAGGGANGNRTALIAKAKTEFAAMANKGRPVCSELALVNTALRDAGQGRLSDEETKRFGIVVG